MPLALNWFWSNDDFELRKVMRISKFKLWLNSPSWYPYSLYKRICTNAISWRNRYCIGRHCNAGRQGGMIYSGVIIVEFLGLITRIVWESKGLIFNYWWIWIFVKDLIRYDRCIHRIIIRTVQYLLINHCNSEFKSFIIILVASDICCYPNLEDFILVIKTFATWNIDG